MILNSEIKEQRVLGTVLPSIFLAVAGFLLNVVLSRMIATQREQIAALKALGYENRAIGLHYLKLVLVIVVIGAVLGLGVGRCWGTGLWASTQMSSDSRAALPGTSRVDSGSHWCGDLCCSSGYLSCHHATVSMAPAEGHATTARRLQTHAD